MPEAFAGLKKNKMLTYIFKLHIFDIGCLLSPAHDKWLWLSLDKQASKTARGQAITRKQTFFMSERVEVSYHSIPKIKPFIGEVKSAAISLRCWLVVEFEHQTFWGARLPTTAPDSTNAMLHHRARHFVSQSNMCELIQYFDWAHNFTVYLTFVKMEDNIFIAVRTLQSCKILSQT